MNAGEAALSNFVDDWTAPVIPPRNSSTSPNPTPPITTVPLTPGEDTPIDYDELFPSESNPGGSSPPDTPATGAPTLDVPVTGRVRDNRASGSNSNADGSRGGGAASVIATVVAGVGAVALALMGVWLATHNLACTPVPAAALHPGALQHA
jgi:hypothetical protein